MLHGFSLNTHVVMCFQIYYPVIRDCVLEHWYCEKALIGIKMVNRNDEI